jgi:hypothetical protein
MNINKAINNIKLLNETVEITDVVECSLKSLSFFVKLLLLKIKKKKKEKDSWIYRYN